MQGNLLFLILLLFFLPIVLSTSSFYFQQNTNIDLKVPCVFNSTSCPSNTICNISINYPSSASFIKNQPMSSQNQYYNYTINSSNTSVVGEYATIVYCSNPTTNGYSLFSFSINNNGKPENYDILPIIIVFGVLIIGFGGLTIFYHNKRSPLRYFTLIATFGVGTILSFLLYKYSFNFSVDITNVMYAIYISSLLLTFTIVLVVIINLIIIIFEIFAQKKKRHFNDTL